MTPEEVKKKWQEYRKTFGGGMVPFDNVMFDEANAHLPEANKWTLGVDAVMATFIEYLRRN